MLIKITERQREILHSCVDGELCNVQQQILEPICNAGYKERILIGFEKELIELEDILMEHGK